MLRRAYSLVELLMAMGLSTGILLTAAAGYRVASQTVTVCNRMSVENQMLQAAVLSAYDQVDFWTAVDDPDQPGPGNQMRGYRGYDGAPIPGGPSAFADGTTDWNLDTIGRNPRFGGGMPFTPLSVAFPAGGQAGTESAIGWDGEEPWLWNDPRCWSHVDFSQKWNSDVRFGHLSCFANLVSPTDVDGYGRVDVPHRWLDNQVWGMHDAMGYYGMFDYLPVNALISCRGPRNAGTSATTNLDGAAQLFLATFSVFAGDDDFVEWCRGRRSASLSGAYPVLSPRDAQGTPRSDADLVSYHQFFYMVGGAAKPGVRNYGTYNFDYVKQQNVDLLADTGEQLPLIAQQPAHWPVVRASVNRFLYGGRFCSLCRVSLRSPLTGERFDIPFSTFGTSLRGARLQRRHPADGGGWASWDDALNAVNDRTLDSP